MLFTTPSFLFGFLPALLTCYFLAPAKLKNILLLAFSLLFYSWGEPIYVILLLISIAINYATGIALLYAGSNGAKKIALFVGIALNLSILGYYKYRAFFTEVLYEALGASVLITDNVHLPIGISFFTFQAISYLVDVYKGKAEPQKNIVLLALYISLFPQLIAGPIVRYHDIQQSLTQRSTGYVDMFIGIERFILGLAKKMLIANPLGLIADEVFGAPVDQLSTGVLWIGAIAFFFQIYFDFSAYSDMAIGLGRMLGFRFMENFNYPYISKSIKEFWRRWHISLSTWFRDYLYIPLGGNRVSPARIYSNLLIVFILCGLWHGASWNFIVWGAYHGIFLLLERSKAGLFLGGIWRPAQRLYVFFVVLVGWVIFRSNSLEQAGQYLLGMLGARHDTEIYYFSFMFADPEFIYAIVLSILISSPMFLLIRKRIPFYHDLGLNGAPSIENSQSILALSFYSLFLLSLFLILMSYVSSSTYHPFIYFQF
ncbi:MAG TPA: MBOAT family O-acyltransferase [Pseudomonadales bacterium]